MGEQHLELLALASGDGISLGGGDVARHIPSTFIDGARHLARWLFRTAPRLQRASLAIVLTRTVEKRSRPIEFSGKSMRRWVIAQAEIAFQRSLDVCGKIQCLPELAQTLLAYGRFRRGNNAQEDRALLERALRLFEEMKSTGWIEETRRALAVA